MAAGLSLIGLLTKKAKLNESREVVRQAREAVIGYVVKNRYLPSNLEAAGARRLDAYGNELIYVPTTEFDASPEDVCSVNSTTIQVYECQNTDCSAYLTKSNIGFVVFSRGFDGNGDGTGSSSPFRVRLQDDAYTSGGTTYNYDDIVAYASLDEIRSLRGCPQPLAVISPSTLPQGEEDSFYSYQLQAIGGKPPYTWDETLGSGLSGSGLSLDSSGLISGTINVNDTPPNTGELTECSGSINVNATVTDSAGSPPQNYTGIIRVRPKPLTIITQTLPSAYEGSPYSATISASGGRTPYSWSISVSPSCPSGLTCSDNSISGTPAPGTAGTYTVTSTVDDTCTTNTKLFVLTINPSGNCLSSGIAITNNTGANRFYRISTDSGTTWSGCNTWPDGGSINITPDQTVRFFRTSQRCDSQQLSCQHTYCTLKGFDTDLDCLIQLSDIADNSCTIRDQ